MSTFKFRASIIGVAVLTLAVFAALTFVFHRPEFPGPLVLWGALALAAAVLGLTVTVALDKPLDRR
ncbi:MAG: hypothetical protein ACRDTI_10965 [Mycobacterium sp.]